MTDAGMFFNITFYKASHLNSLQFGDRCSKCYSLLCIVYCTVKSSLCNPQSLRCNANPASIQGLLKTQKKEKNTYICQLGSMHRLTHTQQLVTVTMAILKPIPGCPKRFSRGIWQSSKIKFAVEEARIPSLSSFFPSERPGDGISTKKALMPCR